jgi:hypothetical protein
MVKQKGNKILLIGIIVTLLVIISLILISLFLLKREEPIKYIPIVPPIIPQPQLINPFAPPDELPDYGCSSNWDSRWPCANAFDGDWETIAEPASGYDGYVYKKFQIPANVKSVTLKARGSGTTAQGYDCGFKVFFYNYSGNDYSQLVNDYGGSVNTRTYEFNISIQDLIIVDKNYLVTVMIKGAYHIGICGTNIHEMEIKYT